MIVVNRDHRTPKALRTFAAFMVAFFALSMVYAQAAGYKIPRTHGPTTRTVMDLQTGQKSGTILISNSSRTLDVVLDSQRVARYNISIGRPGFSWKGTTIVARKAEWPTWRPPAEMRVRDGSLPTMVPPGPHNPLGARALYLYKNGRDTLYRIHGTNSAGTVGGYETSGCFRLTNTDVLELFSKVKIGTKVIVSD